MNSRGGWKGETVVCMASGPSMTQVDADDCRGHRAIVVNTTFRLAPWADVCYSNDHDWMQAHLDELRGSFRGELWCGHPTWRSQHVHSMPFEKEARGASKTGIAWGMNSGAAALDLARWFGAARIVLLGYDQKWSGATPRWHGRHPGKLQNQKPGFHRWATWFEQAAVDYRQLGVEVVNASRETSLRCFARAELKDALCSNC